MARQGDVRIIRPINRLAWLSFYPLTKINASISNLKSPKLMDQLLFTIYIASQISGTFYGIGRHMSDLKRSDAVMALRVRNNRDGTTQTLD